MNRLRFKGEQMTSSNKQRAFVLAALMAGCICLTGCVNPVKPVQGLPADEVSRTTVTKVAITGGPEVPEEVKVNLQAALEKHLANCTAGGNLGRALLVRVDNFKKRNAGAVMLLGDSNNLAGQVRFVDPADPNKMVGEYYIDEVQAGGGLIGLAILENAEKNMPERFAKSVCKRIFNKESTVPSS
jgi:hypothetical protein